MMRKILIIGILVLVFVSINAQKIDVEISQILDGKISAISYDKKIKDVFKIKVEFYNTGSLGYRSRIRLDILNNTDLLFTGWSQEKPLKPSDRAVFNVYWYPYNLRGKFTGKIRVYYANEIKTDDIDVEVKDVSIPIQAIEITDFKTFDDEIEISLKSNETLKNVIIIPSGYPLGWIFEQTKIESMNKDHVKKVWLPYKPSLWEPANVKIEIVTEDGEYYTTKTFSLEREGRLSQFFHDILKPLRRYLTIIL